MQRYKIDICTCDNLAPINHLKYIPNDYGHWVKYEDHATRIAELEAEIAERRMDYGEDCKRLDARIADLEAQLAAANTNVSDLRGKLDYMTAYRNGLRQRLVTKQQQLTAHVQAIGLLSTVLPWRKVDILDPMSLVHEVMDDVAAAQERERTLNDDLYHARKLVAAYTCSALDQEWAAKRIDELI